ncbi:MAG: FAD binding domain-containing protein [Acidimicrobiia bacterium]
MNSFAYVAPKSLDEALELMASEPSNVRPLAGGTDLLADMKHNPIDQSIVMDLAGVTDLGGIETTDSGLRIGAGVTHTEIQKSSLIAEFAPSMITAAVTIGAVQTRNMGTIGGNLVTCVPSVDSGPVLVALDATVTVASTRGRRSMPLTEFFVGPRKTALTPDEILLDIVIPGRMLARPAAFVKFGLRKGQALALVSVAASVLVKDERIVEARVALGAVAPTVIRSRSAETLLEGTVASDTASLNAAAAAAVADAAPIDDFRASARYRQELIRVGTIRALEEALAEADSA